MKTTHTQTHTDTHTHIHINTHAQTHTHTHTHTHIHTYWQHTHTHTRMFVCLFLHTCVCVFVRISVCVCVCVCMYVCAFVCSLHIVFLIFIILRLSNFPATVPNKNESFQFLVIPFANLTPNCIYSNKQPLYLKYWCTEWRIFFLFYFQSIFISLSEIFLCFFFYNSILFLSYLLSLPLLSFLSFFLNFAFH